jgi:hypothetical protein
MASEEDHEVIGATTMGTGGTGPPQLLTARDQQCIGPPNFFD